jgi:hypothetical protein
MLHNLAPLLQPWQSEWTQRSWLPDHGQRPMHRCNSEASATRLCTAHSLSPLQKADTACLKHL